MSEQTQSGKTRIGWYRTPLDRELLNRLNTRSDFRGWIEVLGHLGILAGTGGLAFYAAANWPLWTLIPIVFLHGTVSAFSINGVHELVHRTVFRTRALNTWFARVFAFLGWINHEAFYASHVRHHQYTLHPPDDLEVVLPIRLMAKQFLKFGFVNWQGPLGTLKYHWRIARGDFQGEWELALFPPDEPEKRRAPVAWARTLLIGHGLVLVAAVAFKLWLLPVLVTLAPFYGGWLFWLCNNTQHVGLQDNVPDFRLCCRTFTLNPLVQFLYWHMNFHTEHHMYAGVPCYRLKALHQAIKHDLPPCPHGLVATWKEIAAVLKQQDEDPTYQYVAPLPAQPVA
jgi:fatty acid desaturase